MPGKVIFEANSIVRRLIVIHKGKCNLFGFYDLSEYEMAKIRLVKLVKRSWFGDFQIFSDLPTTLQLEAAGKIDKKEDIVYLYTIDSDKLLELTRPYPAFRSHLTVRATQRRSYFLSVLDEVRQQLELQRKLITETEVGTLDVFDDVREEQKVNLNDLTDHQLDERLLKNIRDQINRKIREFKLSALDKKYDPSAIKNRIKTVELGLHEMTTHEKILLKHGKKKLLRDSAENVDRLRKRGLYMMSITNGTLQVAKEMLDVQTRSWSTYFT